VTGVDEITRHEDPNENCSEPDVIVLSEYVPSELAVHVPVTRKDPVIGAGAQWAPTVDRSSCPVTVRHDDVAVHVPTRLPPQGTTLEQAAPPPPESATTQAPERPASATSITRTADSTFIEW
jgi:hypothetical protein